MARMLEELRRAWEHFILDNFELFLAIGRGFERLSQEANLAWARTVRLLHALLSDAWVRCFLVYLVVLLVMLFL